LQARGFIDPHGVTAFYDSLRAHSPSVAATDKLGSGQAGRWIRSAYVTPFTSVGTAATPVNGTFEFPAAGGDANTVWPNPGRVSVLLPFTGILGIARAATLRRLVAQYGTQGMTITLITKTQGYWLKSGAHTGPVSPAEEAAEDSAYYLGYLHLPVTLIVDSTTFTRDSEGRLQGLPVPFESAYKAKPGTVIVTDRTGHVVVQDVVRDETRLSAYIRKAFGQ
jgi:hypothetical protein